MDVQSHESLGLFT